jgi:uncharacterized protein (DUF1810 family)
MTPFAAISNGSNASLQLTADRRDHRVGLPRNIGSVLLYVKMLNGFDLLEVRMDPYNLQRFIEAQGDRYPLVEAELRAGRKESHWMWYIFPQIKGLGRSATAQEYAISSIDEAKAFLNHRVLGARLRECTRLATAVNGRSIEDIFGYPDHLKFHSCMTLFAHATDDNGVFTDALRKFFRSEYDAQTLERL